MAHHDVAKYRTYAVECMRQAEETDDPARRDKLIDLARTWTNAANTLESADVVERAGADMTERESADIND